MGAGKDTLAAEVSQSRPEYVVWKFETALRQALGLVTDIPIAKTMSDEDKAVDLSGRQYEPADLLARLVRAIEHVTRAPPAAGVPETMFQILTGLEFAPPGGDGPVTIPMTVGRLLQVLGTECFRNLVGPEVWVEALTQKWAAEGRPAIVIADVRFPNESAAVRDLGGVVILVRRKLAERADGRATGHASEHALDGEEPDIAIDNDGTVAALRAAFDAAWPSILELARKRASGAGGGAQGTSEK